MMRRSQKRRRNNSQTVDMQRPYETLATRDATILSELMPMVCAGFPVTYPNYVRLRNELSEHGLSVFDRYRRLEEAKIRSSKTVK